MVYLKRNSYSRIFSWEITLRPQNCVVYSQAWKPFRYLTMDSVGNWVTPNSTHVQIFKPCMWRETSQLKGRQFPFDRRKDDKILKEILRILQNIRKEKSIFMFSFLQHCKLMALIQSRSQSMCPGRLRIVI
jgi:hypothetical protein